MSEDDRIFEIAIDLMLKSSMRHDLWQATSLATVHPAQSLPVELETGERVLVSAQFPNGDWYVWTTRWLVSFFEGRQERMRSEDVGAVEFGRFKGHPGLINDPQAPLQSLVATAHGKAGRTLRFCYELGYASMGPVQCHQYWSLKHPILHKLMTPTEREKFRRSK